MSLLLLLRPKNKKPIWKPDGVSRLRLFPKLNVDAYMCSLRFSPK
jgi:hypothetical protein